MSNISLERARECAAGGVILLRTIESTEAIAAESVRAIVETVPGYDGVSADALTGSVRRNIVMSTRVLRSGAAPHRG